MKRTTIKKFIFLFFCIAVGCLSFIKSADAVSGTCVCKKEVYVLNCASCNNALCFLSVVWFGDSGTYINLDVTSTPCSSPENICYCGAAPPNINRSDCPSEYSGITCAFFGPADVGEPCQNDFECSGPGCRGGCYCQDGSQDAAEAGEDLPTFWAERGVSSGECAAKKAGGDWCVRSEYCQSNNCVADASGLSRTCQRPGATEIEVGAEIFPTYHINSPIGEVTGPGLIGRIIKTVLGIVGALALAMFVYGGFTWLTSGGSPDKIKKGKDILMWATIGLVIIFSSYTLVDFLLKSFGL